MFKRFSLISNTEKFKDTAFDVIVCMGQSNCAGYGKANKELSFLLTTLFLLIKMEKLFLQKREGRLCLTTGEYSRFILHSFIKTNVLKKTEKFLFFLQR